MNPALLAAMRPRVQFRPAAPGAELGTVLDLVATPGDGRVTLTWTPAANSDGQIPEYRIGTSGAWSYWGGALSPTASQVEVTGLTNGVTYQFRIVAGLNDGVTVTYGNEVTVTPEPPVGLGTPSNLSATPHDGEVALTWTPAANATSHQPQHRAGTSGTWQNAGEQMGGSASSRIVTGLTNGQLYQFRVQASDGSNTTTSSVVSATPQVPEPTGIDHPAEALAMIGSLPVVLRRHFNALDEFDEITGTRWNDADGAGSGVNSTLRIQPDPLNPANSVGWMTYPVGYSGNGTTSHQARADAPWATRTSGWIYVRFRYYYTGNWYGHDGSSVNKIWYIGHPIVPIARGSGTGPLHLALALQGGENFNGRHDRDGNEVSPTSAQAEMRRGEWTDVAIVYNLGTQGVYDGQMHAWMRHPGDANPQWVKTHQFHNRRLLAAASAGPMYSTIDFLSWRPIYGGQGGTNIFAEQSQAMDFCEVRASNP